MKVPFNLLVLRLFAPILVLVGIMGFVVPPSAALTSGAAPYAVFHIVFGLIGLGCVASRNLGAMRLFNFGFGVIDLYQALASFFGLWPLELFRWTRVDDGLHIVVGLGLVAVSLAADRQG